MSTITNIAKIPDLRQKILFTLFIIVVYRLGSVIPVPGIDLDAVQTLQDQADEGGALGFLQLFTGGALTNFAVFALGIMPYITSSIIMQLLGVVIPRIEQWQQQGAVGQRKITQWTRYITVALALMQSTGLVFLFHNGGGGFVSGSTVPFDLVPEFTVPRVALIVMTLTAGTAVVMWLGELISQKGVGNGMSILIFTSVVSGLPFQFWSIRTQGGWSKFVLFVILSVGILFSIVFVEQGQRRIPVQFAKRVVGRRMYGGQNTYIPLKVNQSGVIPIIFASSVLYFPVLIGNVVSASWFDPVRRFVDRNLLQPDNLWYISIYGLMIVFFAYFYTAIQFDPVKQADSIRKQGGYIPGIRPGPPTERHLAKILSRLTLPGAVFLALVALAPSVLLAAWSIPQFAFGGASLLIAAGVALETMKQVDSQLMMRNYEGFLK